MLTPETKVKSVQTRVIDGLVRGRYFYRREHTIHVGEEEIPVQLSMPTPESRRWMMTRCGDGPHEPQLAEVLADAIQPDGVFWDIGAHWGVYTALAGAIGSYGVAVDVHARKLRVVRQHPDAPPNLSTVRSAITDTTGDSVNLGPVVKHRPSTTSLASDRDSAWSTECPTMTLDHLLSSYPVPDVVKIDIEGEEGRALAGADRLLTKARPDVLVIAVHPDQMAQRGDQPEDVRERMSEFGYNVRRLEDTEQWDAPGHLIAES